MATFADFWSIQGWLLPKAQSQAAANVVERASLGKSLFLVNVTFKKVSNHIILNRFLAVELYSLN